MDAEMIRLGYIDCGLHFLPSALLCLRETGTLRETVTGWMGLVYRISRWKRDGGFGDYFFGSILLSLYYLLLYDFMCVSEYLLIRVNDI